MGKSEEVEGAVPIVGGLSTGRLPERDQSRLLRVNGQAKARKALGQYRHNPARVLLDFAPADQVSRPWEPPPRPLAELCMNLSAHTAPIIQPPVARPSASERRVGALSAQCVRASALLAVYDAASACISASPTGLRPGPDGER